MFWNGQPNADKEGKFALKKLILFKEFEESILGFQKWK